MFNANIKIKIPGKNIADAKGHGFFNALARLFRSKVENSHMLGFMKQLEKIFHGLEVDNAVALYANHEQIWKDEVGVEDDIAQMTAAWEEHCQGEPVFKQIKKINVLMEHLSDDVLYLLDFKINGTWAAGVKLDLTALAEPQAPEGLKAKKLKEIIESAQEKLILFMTQINRLLRESFLVSGEIQKQAVMPTLAKGKSTPINTEYKSGDRRYPNHPYLHGTNYHFHSHGGGLDIFDAILISHMLSSFQHGGWGLVNADGGAIDRAGAMEYADCFKEQSGALEEVMPEDFSAETLAAGVEESYFDSGSNDTPSSVQDIDGGDGGSDSSGCSSCSSCSGCGSCS